MRRASVAALVAVSLLSSLGSTRADPAGGPDLSREWSPGAVSRVPGKMVRRTPDALVTKLVVNRAGALQVLYRVRIAGRFPARALRYEIKAGGEIVGHGTPTTGGRALVTVTSDSSVLTEDLSASYPEAPEPVLESEPSGTTEEEWPSIPNPARPGPHEVSKALYDLGDEAFQPQDVSYRVEVAASVRYPSDLNAGPYPLVLFMHGNHASCYRKRATRSQWPCRDGWKRMPNHRGYNYMAEPLASHGYIVVSVSANGVNVKGHRHKDTGMRQRGELLDEHLRLWQGWSSTGGGPFEERFVGAVDMSRIGTMGHSRGGEGVVWHKIVDDERAEPFGVDAVLSLAPVDFTRRTINGVPFATVLPTCDGDVSDLQGMHLFDDSRYNLPGDPAPKHSVTLVGPNHNYFNEIWSPSSGFPGARDDGDTSACFSERMKEKPQRRLGASYIVGFFRRYLGDELEIDPMWTGVATPRFTDPEEARVSYHAPDTALYRRDLNRFTRSSDLEVNQLGGKVFGRDLSMFGWCKNTERTPCLDRDWTYFDVHHPGLAQGIVGWEDRDGHVSMRIPAGSRDVSSFDALQFRGVVPPTYDYANRGSGRQDLSVVLQDGAGGRAKVAASEVGNHNLTMPGSLPYGHVLLNQTRFPLTVFAGVDLEDVRIVKFVFDRRRSGVVQIADVAFSRGEAVLPTVP